MTVADLIELLKTKPQDLQVAYAIHSEFCLLEPEDISVDVACPPRTDGWIQRSRRDYPSQQYLMLPGN